MEAGELRSMMKECLKDDEIQSLLLGKMEAIVAKAVAAKDREIADLKDELRRTNDQLNDLEQYSRRLCINVTGVPETAGESTDQIVTDLAKMAGVTVTRADIDRTHRIGKPGTGKVRPIIARFTNFAKCQDVYIQRAPRAPQALSGPRVRCVLRGGRQGFHL